jgi:hypothetical protein
MDDFMSYMKVSSSLIESAVSEYLVANPPSVDLSDSWPVGSVFASVVETNPASLLGFGTWQAFGAGRTLVGVDSGDEDFDTAEETGGAKTVQLNAAQSGLPAHSHVATDAGHVHAQTAPTSASGGAVGFANDNNASGADATGNNNTQAGQADITVEESGPAGAAEAHENMPPYVVVYFWKRTE